MSGPPTLITIGLSHFCEKARWALQRYGVEFTEEPHVPGANRPAAKAAGGRGSTPCLRLAPSASAATDGGSSGSLGPECIDESTPILRWVDAQAAAAAARQNKPALPPLFPPGAQGEEAERLCTEFDCRLGPDARLWAYSHLLFTPTIQRAMVAPPVPAVEKWVLWCGGWWVLRRLMAKGLHTTPENGVAALKRIRAEFDKVAALLADGRPYLTGEQFTAADLTFAALAAPAVGQAYAWAPGLDADTPPAMRKEVEELREHPAGKFALRLWQTERDVVLN